MTGAPMTMVLCLLAGPGAARSDQKVPIPRRPAPGHYVLTSTAKLSQTLTVDGRARPALLIYRTLVLAMNVQPPALTGEVQIEMSFRRIAYTVSTRGRMLTYDSGDADAQPSRLSQLLRPLLKANILVTLDAMGSVRQAKGLNAVWDARAEEEPQASEWINQIKAEMGDAIIARLLDLAPQALPTQPVAAGDRWQAPMRFRLPYVGDRRRTQEVELKSIQRKGAAAVAVIDLADHYEDQTTSVVQVQPMPLTVQRLQVNQTGELRVGLKSFAPLSLSLARTSTLTMSGTDPSRGSVTAQLSHNWSTAMTLRADTGQAAQAK